MVLGMDISREINNHRRNWGTEIKQPANGSQMESIVLHDLRSIKTQDGPLSTVWVFLRKDRQHNVTPKIRRSRGRGCLLGCLLENLDKSIPRKQLDARYEYSTGPAKRQEVCLLCPHVEKSHLQTCASQHPVLQILWFCSLLASGFRWELLVLGAL